MEISGEEWTKKLVVVIVVVGVQLPKVFVELAQQLFAVMVLFVVWEEECISEAVSGV